MDYIIRYKMIQRHNQNCLTYRVCRDRQVTVTLNQKTFLCRSKSADHDERMIWTIVWSLFFWHDLPENKLPDSSNNNDFQRKSSIEISQSLQNSYWRLWLITYEWRNCWYLISLRILAGNAFKNFTKLILTPILKSQMLWQTIEWWFHLTLGSPVHLGR